MNTRHEARVPCTDSVPTRLDPVSEPCEIRLDTFDQRVERRDRHVRHTLWSMMMVIRLCEGEYGMGEHR